MDELPIAKLGVASALTDPQKPLRIEVIVDQKTIAVVSLEDFKWAAAELAKREGAR